MFSDIRNNMSSQNVIAADVCVIGGGAAGIAITRELADSRLRVVLVESGGLEPSALDTKAYEVIANKKLNLGHDSGKPCYLGGNTNYWFGTCRPFDAFDFKLRDWMPNSGWPVDADEMGPYYERAQAMCGLDDFRWYDIETCRPHLAHLPMDRASGILKTCIEQVGPVLSFTELHGERLANSDNVEVLLGSRAICLKTNPQGTHVSAVELANGDGRRRHVEAGVFVLATGGVENARLLLCSTDASPNGLGNQGDLVGRFFMEHCYFTLGLGGWSGPDLSLYEIPARREVVYENLEKLGHAGVYAQLALSDELMRRECAPGLSLWFARTPPDTPSVAALRRITGAVRHRARLQQPLTDARLIFSDPMAIPGHVVRKLRGADPEVGESYALNVQLEQTPDPENRITLSTERDRFGQPRAKLALRFTAEERRAHARSLRLAADAIGLNGARLARQMGLMIDAGYFGFFWHHMGTTRMAHDPDEGVVDSQCRVHGIANLFVAGSSVFPTGGTAPPTLTIVALALRMADHIRAEKLLTASS
jgi:choline dehydrogenase-like flavoprotein